MPKSNLSRKACGVGVGAVAGVCTVDSAICVATGNALGAVFSGGLALIGGYAARECFTPEEKADNRDVAFVQEPAEAQEPAE